MFTIPDYVLNNPLLLDLHHNHFHPNRYGLRFHYDRSEISISDRDKWDIVREVDPYTTRYLTMDNELIDCVYLAHGMYYYKTRYVFRDDVEFLEYEDYLICEDIWKKRRERYMTKYLYNREERIRQFNQYFHNRDITDKDFSKNLLTAVDIRGQIKSKMNAKNQYAQNKVPKNFGNMESLLFLESLISNTYGSYVLIRTDINLRKNFIKTEDGTDPSDPKYLKEDVIKKISNNLRFNSVSKQVLDYAWTVEINRDDIDNEEEKRWHIHIYWFMKDDISDKIDYSELKEGKDPVTEYNNLRVLVGIKQREKELIMNKGTLLLKYLTGFLSAKKYVVNCIYNEDNVTVVKKDNIEDRNLIVLWLTYISKEYYNTRNYRKEHPGEFLYGRSKYTANRSRQRELNV
nr:MAG TPA: hypothetical protein [Caudoviricetes sp.]